jgi:hypothetical protein
MPLLLGGRATASCFVAIAVALFLGISPALCVANPESGMAITPTEPVVIELFTRSGSSTTRSWPRG